MKNIKKRILSFALCLSLLCMVLSPLCSIAVFADGEDPEELADVVAGETLIAEDFSTTAIGSKPDGWVLHTGGWVWNGDKGTAAVTYDGNDEKKLSITSPAGTAALVLPSLGTANYEMIVKVHLDAASGTIGLLTNIKDPVSQSNTWSTAVTHTYFAISSGKVTIKDRAMTGNYNETNYTASAYSAGDDVKLTARCYNSSTYFYIDDTYIGKIEQRNPQTVSSLCGFYAVGATVSLNYVTVSALTESTSGDSGYNADDIRNDVTVKETIIDEDLTVATEIPEGWELNKTSRVWNSASSSMSITEGGLAVTNNSGDLELNLPSIYTSDYALTVNMIPKTHGGNIGLLTNVKDPYTSSTYATRTYIACNADNSKETVQLQNKGGSNNSVSLTLSDIISGGVTPNQSIELSVYSYKGYSYFYINGTFAGKFEQYDPNPVNSLCGIYLCGTHVVVTSVTVESIMKIGNVANNMFGRIGIIGDSYSTYEGYIPSGYASWYNADGNNNGESNTLSSVNQTWWKLLADDTKSYIVTNCSYSGSTVCGIGYGGGNSYSTSFVKRAKDYFNGSLSYDTIFIFGGTNDSWAGSPVGEVKYSEFDESDYESFLPSFCYLIDYLQNNNPESRIIVLINDALTNNKAAMISGMKSACGHYDVEYVELSGVNKQNEHPSIEGMKTIKNQIIDTCGATVSFEGGLYSTERILDEDFSDVADGEMPNDWSIYEKTGAWAYNPTAAKTVQVESAGGKKYLGITCWTGTAAVMLPFNRTSDYVVTAYITPQSNNGMIGLLSNVQYPLSKSRVATHSVLYLSNNNNDKKICQYSRVGNNKYDLQEYSDTELLGRSYGTGDLIKLTAYSYKGITYFYINDTYVGLIEQKNAELEYSYCGIFVYGTSVRVNSVTVDKIEQNGSTSSINLLGAQLRYAGTSGYSASSDATGIRFVSEFDKNSFLYKNNFESNYSYDEDAIAQIGTVILPSSSLAIGEKLTVHTSGAVVLPVTSDYEQTEDKLTSYTTIIGGDDFDGYYAARSYIKIRNDYYYSNQIERSKSRLATRCYADDSTASAVKDKLDMLFSSSSGYLTGAEVKTLDFTVIGDLHYKQGMYAASVADLETMIGRAVANNSNFVLHMGDFCNDYLGSKELTNAWMASFLPAYGIYGNHELESAKNSMRYVTPLLTNESASVVWGTPDGTIGDGSIAYYYFDDASGFRVVCTDTNYSWNPTYKVWDHNKTNSYGGPNGDTLYNSLGDKQLRWLEDVLTDAAERDIPCIVLSHATLSGSWEPSPDSEAVQAIFRRVNSIKKGTVMLALNGHNHKDHMKIIDGVTYLDVNMVRNAFWNANATWHYTDGQTFEYVTYDADGNVVSTEDASLNVLSGAEKTWFTQDPVSCNIKISTAGYIIIDGYQSEWLYGLDPEIDEVTGVMPEIVDRTINYVY